jgi:uncharacterized protein (TIGR02285 family)
MYMCVRQQINFYISRCLTAAVFGGAFLYPAPLWANDTIRWLIIDYPPIYITTGDNAGQGVVDQALRLITAKMPEYKHVIEVGTVSRVTEAMKRGENVCIPTLFVTEERKQFGHFSVYPTTFLPPLAVLTRKDEMNLFRSGQEPVSLRHLLANEGSTLGVVANHSYGREVDSVITTHQGKSNLVVRSGISATEGLLEMVLKRRIDYTIAYPWSISAKLGAETASQFGAIAFEEAGTHPRHHVLCTGNQWGNQVIRRIDQVLKTALPTTEYRSFIEQWLPPDSLPSFRSAYDEFLAVGVK